MIDINKLRTKQVVYHKTIFSFPDKLTITKIDLKNETIHFDDNTYLNKYSFKNLYTNRKECLKDLKKDMEERLLKLKQMLKEEK